MYGSLRVYGCVYIDRPVERNLGCSFAHRLLCRCWNEALVTKRPAWSWWQSFNSAVSTQCFLLTWLLLQIERLLLQLDFFLKMQSTVVFCCCSFCLCTHCLFSVMEYRFNWLAFKELSSSIFQGEQLPFVRALFAVFFLAVYLFV